MMKVQRSHVGDMIRKIFRYSTLSQVIAFKGFSYSFPYLIIVSLHGDALLVSFNEVLHPFQKETVQLLTKQRLHHLLVWAPNMYKPYNAPSHHAL